MYFWVAKLYYYFTQKYTIVFNKILLKKIISHRSFSSQGDAFVRRRIDKSKLGVDSWPLPAYHIWKTVSKVKSAEFSSFG
jgi:hypothetical protein